MQLKENVLLLLCIKVALSTKKVQKFMIVI